MLGLLVVQNDFIIPINQAIARVNQVVIHAIGRRKLFRQRNPELVIDRQLDRRLRKAALALAIVNTAADHRNRRVAQAQGNGLRVFLSVASTEQSNLIAVVFFINGFGCEFRQRRQITFQTQVITIGRSLQVIIQIRRFLPFRDPHINVCARSNVVCECLGADA